MSGQIGNTAGAGLGYETPEDERLRMAHPSIRSLLEKNYDRFIPSSPIPSMPTGSQPAGNYMQSVSFSDPRPPAPAMPMLPQQELNLQQPQPAQHYDPLQGFAEMLNGYNRGQQKRPMLPPGFNPGMPGTETIAADWGGIGGAPY